MNQERFAELAVKVALGLATDEEKVEFGLMKRAVKKDMKGTAVATPEGMIAKLRKQIEKLEATIAYIEENGEMPAKSKRGRKAKNAEQE